MMRQGVAVAAIVIILTGCRGGPILANPPAQRPIVVTPTQPPAVPADPIPIELPRDDGPHDRLMEWWYYTGHLRDEGGGRWGFEYVIFRAERGDFPVSWASHLALTDETGDAFSYAQRTEIGPQVDQGADAGFTLEITGFDPTAAQGTIGNPWSIAGHDGTDRLRAEADAGESLAESRSFGLDLLLRATKPPALHDSDGWIEFGAAGGSYYYSRTAMAATGTLAVDGQALDVEGSAWFDHQWGDFIAVGGGGWDWFAVNLDDGTDVTLSLVRDADGSYPLEYGTVVMPDGETRHLPPDAFEVEVTDSWTSPDSGATYPAGWRISLPAEGLEIDLEPTVADQELDTRTTTGVIYWEGSQRVRATRDGSSLGGEAYVELTGYADVLQAP